MRFPAVNRVDVAHWFTLSVDSPSYTKTKWEFLTKDNEGARHDVTKSESRRINRRRLTNFTRWLWDASASGASTECDASHSKCKKNDSAKRIGGINLVEDDRFLCKDVTMINVDGLTNRNWVAGRVCGLLAQYYAECGVPSALEAPPLATRNWRMSRGSEISGVCEGSKLPHDIVGE